MQKTVQKYGLISGALLIFFMFSTSLVWGDKMDYVMATIIGYMTMVISLVPVYLGVKDVRNNHLSGFIDLKQALKSGLGIVLIAALIYTVGYLIFYELIGKEFMENNHQTMLEDLKSSGLSEEEISNRVDQMTQIKDRYDSLAFRLSYPFMDLIPPGFIIALLSSLFLMRKAPKNA